MNLNVRQAKLMPNRYGCCHLTLYWLPTCPTASDITDCVWGVGYISKQTQVRAFALLMYNKGLEEDKNAETVAKLCSPTAS